MNNINVQMNMSFDEFNKLKNGLPCYGYSQGYTTYPISIQVPIKFIKNTLDLSEGHNEYYEYEIEWENEEGINQLDPNKAKKTMNYRQCLSEEIPTHVLILDTETNRDKLTTLDLKIHGVHEILKGEDGEDMIKNNNGEFLSDFLLYIDVEFLVTEVNEK